MGHFRTPAPQQTPAEKNGACVTDCKTDDKPKDQPNPKQTIDPGHKIPGHQDRQAHDEEDKRRQLPPSACHRAPGLSSVTAKGPPYQKMAIPRTWTDALAQAEKAIFSDRLVFDLKRRRQ